MIDLWRSRGKATALVRPIRETAWRQALESGAESRVAPEEAQLLPQVVAAAGQKEAEPQGEPSRPCPTRPGAPAVRELVAPEKWAVAGLQLAGRPQEPGAGVVEKAAQEYRQALLDRPGRAATRWSM
jgi:hypothetical protein